MSKSNKLSVLVNVSKPKRLPKLCLHKHTGQGYATDPITHKPVYFGEYGTQNCLAAYDLWAADYLTRRNALPPPKSAPASPPKPPKPVAGFVYLIAADGLHWKIGKGADPKSRLYFQQIGNHQRLELRHVIQTDDMAWLEQAMHEHFAEQHVRGEWFALSAEDVASFCLIDVWNCGQLPQQCLPLAGHPWLSEKPFRKPSNPANPKTHARRKKKKRPGKPKFERPKKPFTLAFSKA